MKSIRTMRAGSELCAPIGVTSSQEEQREKDLPKFCRPSNEGGAGKWSADGVRRGEVQATRDSATQSTTNNSTDLVLMSRVCENVRSESVSSRAVQVVILVNEVFKLQLLGSAQARQQIGSRNL
jgi:hypothetical protein